MGIHPHMRKQKLCWRGSAAIEKEGVEARQER